VRPPAFIALAGAAVALVACGAGTHDTPVREGDAGRGHERIEYYGCGACHRIGGVEGANGRVGPSLRHFDANRFIAGRLPNTPDNVVRWILDPQAIEPDTIMPDLGLSEAEARDVAAYLYTQ
jgi:cytochrome c